MYDPEMLEIPGAGYSEWLGDVNSPSEKKSEGESKTETESAETPTDTSTTPPTIQAKYDDYHKTPGCLLPPTAKQRCQGLSFTLWIPCEEFAKICGDGNPCQPCMDCCSECPNPC
jgi:hypothetical protein